MIQTAFLGDVVLTTPLLAVLAQRHGPVDVVTHPGAAPLLETHPAVRRVIVYDKHGRERGPGALWRLARKLRADRYAVAYLPHRSLRSAALAWLARVPSRIGFHDGWPTLYTEVRRRPAEGHEIDRLLALAGVPRPPGTRPTLALLPSDRGVAERALREAGIGHGFVALAPGSIWGSKRWPYYPDLGAALAERGSPVVVLGSRQDESLGDTVVGAVRRAGGQAVSTCGRLSLRESAALIGLAAVLVTNDSAPLHLAQAVETPVVAIFGPTVPAFGFGPRGPRDRALGVPGLDCRPCHRHGPPACPLGHHRCMRDLTVAEVLHAIEETGALRRRD
ncbi:MAG TPA: lipopolysaccharide heptosyltransferase II [Gemmatimonadales bacterium]|nr:lipopolysaccharide heptosyltransferase II [Gemmatimonadales bacterium]